MFTGVKLSTYNLEAVVFSLLFPDRELWDRTLSDTEFPDVSVCYIQALRVKQFSLRERTAETGRKFVKNLFSWNLAGIRFLSTLSILPPRVSLSAN